MKEADIINKAIDNEKLAIKDQIAVAIGGGLLTIASIISLPTVLSEFINKEEILIATISNLSPVLVGLITIPYPTKEILDRRENIRNLQTIQYTCDVILKPNEEEKCLELIAKYL